MKKMLFIILLAATVWACGNSSSTKQTPDATDTMPQASSVPEHSALTSLDYAGKYVGTLPCADCEGIETEVTLTTDGSFVKKTRYLGKNNQQVYEHSGKFTWNEAGNTITLEGVEGANQYFVAENTLIQLDLQGNRITGQLAEKYMLKK